MIEIKKGVIVSPQLAPPAIPTGTIPADTCGVIGEKTDVYLDICSEYALGQIYMFGWGFVFWVGGISTLIMGRINNFISSDLFIIFVLLFSPIFIGMIVALFKCPPPPTLRFNRQRRELYIRYKVGHEEYYKKAQWEDIRTFMELGSNACPKNNRSTTSELNLLFNQFKSKDIRGAFWTLFRIVP